MAFKFRLEKVLHHRKSLEDLARKEYLEAQADLAQEQDTLARYFSAIEEAGRERHHVVLHPLHQGERLRQINEYIKGTEIRIERQKATVQEHLAKVEKLRLALQAASTEYKIIERLKEHRKLDHRNSLEKRDAKELDEMVNARYKLRTGNE